MKVLLHICCGICAGSVAERLFREGHRVTGFFFNPNIHPSEEYSRRLSVTMRVADWLRMPVVVPDYDPSPWLQHTKELAQEPEGGKRCEICFRIRLQAAYEHSCRQGYDCFTTTLTVSPHKNATLINKIGTDIGKTAFLSRDFKKQDGFKRSHEIAKELDLYHQKYCGCVYSFREPLQS